MEAQNINRVVKYIIRNTPNGHLNEVIENLKVLVGSSVIESPVIQAELRSYDEDHFRQVRIEDEKIILSKYNRSDCTGEEDCYYDAERKVKIQVSPLSENKIQTLTEEDVEPTSRRLLDKSLNDYREKFYKSGIASSNGIIFRVSNDKHVLIISAHNLNYKNFWTGEWLSCWELEKIGNDSYSLKGTVKANTFYYEEGNIQFNLNNEFNETFIVEDEETLGSEVVKIIEEKENKIQVDLDQVYDNFSDNYIKPLRRKLPITGSKMNWSLNQIGMLK